MAGFFKTDPKPKRTKKAKTAKDITLDELIAELDNARLVAGTNGNATAMISATMAKAKLLGLDKGNSLEVNHTIKPTTIELIAQPFPNDPVQASQYYKELMQ